MDITSNLTGRVGKPDARTRPRNTDDNVIPFGFHSTHPWWLWPNTLSLDAVAIAVSWQWLFAHAFGVPLTSAQAVVLGLGIWMSYMGDRWLDACRIPPGRIVTTRHLFHARFRFPILAILGSTCIAAITLAGKLLSARDFRTGWFLLIFVAAYFLLVHFFPSSRSPFRFIHLPIKELGASGIFAAGVGLFLLDQGLESNPGFFLALAWFTALCWLNCLSIASAESSQDRAQGQASSISHFPWLRPYIKPLCLALALGSLVLPCFQPSHLAYLYLCIAFGFLSLWVLNGRSEKVELSLFRVLADMALLGPVIVLPFLW